MKDTYIFGISCFYHDSAACLLKNGNIIAAAQEERFTRIKHDNSLPINSINFCLKYANIKISNINYIGFYEKPILKFDRILSTFTKTYPKSLNSFCNAIPSWLTQKLRVRNTIRKKLNYKNEIIFIKHHLSHASSTFFSSGFNESAIITIDGVGEWDTATISIGNKNNIKILHEMHFPNSVGLLYSTITSYLGFRVNNDEYKVMGLAAYGEPKYEKEFKKIVKINDDGSIKLNMKYFSFEDSKRMFNIKLEKLLGKKRLYKEPITQRHKDIAYALQKITEKIVLKMVNFSHKETNSKNLCLAGGVALNSVSNGNIEQNSKFKNIFIQPASSDSGGAIGVAQYIHHSILKNERKNKMDHIFFGPDYKSKNIRQFLIKNNIKYVEYKKKKLLEKTASLIWNNNVIGWFQGRMEFGPRALGNRSILANPSNPKMKDIINKKVKHRESFRPFAPACLLNKAKDYFDIKTESPFMLKICTVKSNKRKILPSITHIDGTARLQTVKKSNNEKFYDLIVQFEKLSKIPVLLNTSFNVMGEPIVNSPQDAYDCFKNTGIDYLIMENFIIEKNQINNYNNNNNK